MLEIRKLREMSALGCWRRGGHQIPRPDRDSEWQLGVGELAVGHVEIGAAHAARRHAQQDLPRSGDGAGDGRRAQRPAGGVEHLGAHLKFA